MSLFENPNYTLNPKFEDIQLADEIALDLETNGEYSWKHKIRLISIYSEKGHYLLQPEFYQGLDKFFEKLKGHKIVCHNTKFDTAFIYTHYGVLLENIFCTMLASQVYQGGVKTFRNNLSNCLKSYLGVDLGEDKEEMQKSFLNDKPLTTEQLNYAAKDTKYLLKLKEKLIELTNERGLEKVVSLENKLTPVLVKMEANGCLIDVDKWKQQIVKWEGIKRDIVKELDEEVMKIHPYYLFTNINYASPKQILQLFKDMKQPLPTLTDSKTKESRHSLEEGVIDNYINENDKSPLVNFLTILKRYREYDKLISTYGESFLDRLDSKNHIHTKYSQCSTSTARLSSSDPNLQNIPSDKSGEGSIVREYFIAPKGYKFITSDMSKAEIVIAADLSKEPMLVKSLKEGLDMHSELASVSASIIYGQPVKITDSKTALEIKGQKIVPKDFRDVHKSVTFSKFYKGGPKRVYEILARYINPVTPANKRMMVAKKISEAIDKALPKLSYFLDRRIEEANEKKYLVTTKLGRRRYFDKEVYGEAANAKIQASNADAIKIAMINIDKWLTGKGRMVLSVHDEVCCVVKDEFSEEAANVIKKEMSKALTWQLSELTGGATVKISDHWEK